MGKLKGCEYWYDKEDIEKDIRFATAHGQDDIKSVAYSLSAISKSLYNIMAIMDREEGNNG